MNKFPLPVSPHDGWPWNVEMTQEYFNLSLSSQNKDSNKSLPRISIITPSFNQGQYIEETIRSVILQDYPNLEYIIIDGGSTDNTVDIIKKYEPWITYWVSERDSGQSEAINKGFKVATGEWVAWLNSDDLYLPNTLIKLANIFKGNENISWVVGTTEYINDKHHRIGEFVPEMYTARGRSQKYTKQGWLDFICTKQSGIALPQPSSFWKREAVSEVGYLDESLQYVMDHELYGRLARKGFFPTITQTPYTLFRVHPAQKTTHFPNRFLQEELGIVRRLKNEVCVDGKQILRRYVVWFRYVAIKNHIKRYIYKCLSFIRNLESKNIFKRNI